MAGDMNVPVAMSADEFARRFRQLTNFKENRFHPLVWINGEPEIDHDVSIGFFSEINARGARVRVGAHCDIASFVSINCADSHKRCIGLTDKIERSDITIEDHVFIGSHCFISGGAHIGHHSVIGAGTIVGRQVIPPYSLAVGNPMQLRPGYYSSKLRGVGDRDST
jgi:acetyltransferase-like isoleucine patch superfamily enzyme